MENLEEVPAEQGGVGKESHLNYVNFRQKTRPQIRVCISYFRDNLYSTLSQRAWPPSLYSLDQLVATKTGDILLHIVYTLSTINKIIPLLPKINSSVSLGILFYFYMFLKFPYVSLSHFHVWKNNCRKIVSSY